MLPFFLGEDLEILIEIIFEFIIQLFAEGIAELLVRGIGIVLGDKKPTQNGLTFFAYIGLGILFGGISLAMKREHFIIDPTLRIMNLIFTPVFIGLIMSWRGKSLKKKEAKTIKLDSFTYGFIFSFTIALIRYLYGK